MLKKADKLAKQKLKEEREAKKAKKHEVKSKNPTRR
jgi:hypothetical protein